MKERGKAKARGLPFWLRGFWMAGPPGKPSPSRLATLSKASPAASSIVPPKQFQIERIAAVVQARVPAADDQSDAGKHVAPGRQPASVNMCRANG